MLLRRRLGIILLCSMAPAIAFAEADYVRAKAVKDLAKGGGSIEQLRPYLKDASADVRVEAVKGIVDIGGKDSLQPLVEATRDNNPDIQIRAVDGLVNFYLPGYIQGRLGRFSTKVKNTWSDQNDQVIPSYVVVRPDVIDALRPLIVSGASDESRQNAARAAGILRGRGALPELVKALHSKESDLMYESLVAIRKIGDPKAVNDMLFTLNDPEEKVQLAALETAGVLRNEAALPDVRKAYDRSKSTKVKRTALESLAMLQDPGDHGMFLAAANDKDDGVRAAAYEGLGRIHSKQDEGMLQNALAQEKKVGPRLAAAFALVKLGHTETTEFSALQYLVNTLNSRAHKGEAEPYLIEAARQPQVRENLYPLIGNGTKDEKIGIAHVLAASGDRNSVATLDKLSRDSDPEVAEESLQSLRVLRARLI